MIRPTTAADRPALCDLLVATKLFGDDELEPVMEMLDSHLDGGDDAGHRWLTNDVEGPVGVAYCAPETMAEGTWNLYLLAVHPDQQGRGHGAALVRHVEESLSAGDARLLLIETSALPQFDRARSFYERLGFEREAAIRDFYAAGDDKIIYRKALL